MPGWCSTRCWKRSARPSRSDRDATAVAAEIAASHKEWLAKWMPKLTHNDAPLNPYRVLWDLQHTVDIKPTPSSPTTPAARATSSRRSGSCTVEPLSYIGWGKTTQLGYGLGLAMGAKLAKPDKLCINVWGDAAIGFTGMDFETAVRERIPIMSILLNNFSMAIELKVMPISTEKYRSTDISGDYAAMARAFGGYGERVTKPEDIIPAIKRGIAKTKKASRCCWSSSPARRPRSRPGPTPPSPPASPAGQRPFFHQRSCTARPGHQRRGGAEHVAERRDHVGGGIELTGRDARRRARCPRPAPSAGSR
jgi:hypothetical protein